LKFIKPKADATGSDIRPGSSTHAREDWLKEWVLNQGKYVTLECGDRIDLTDRNVLTEVTRSNADRRVWCYDCETVRAVVRPIGLFEFHYGYLPEPLPDEPPF
jgi:hypothetical protein